MSENYQKLREMALTSISQSPNPTKEFIRQAVDELRAIPMFHVDDEHASQLCREIEAMLDISISIGSVIQEEFEEWLIAAKEHIEPHYWDRYRRLLVKKKFPKQVIARIDEVTDRTLGLLGNPRDARQWDRRGMVVGHVQSGKTANYTGLICKAADAGYKLIIIIAGIHNNLRNQTQARIDEGFVGRDSGQILNSGAQKLVGVGLFDSRKIPLTVTNTRQDFNKQAATMFGVQLRALNVPAVLVIKKNASTLKHLNEWLKTHNAQGDSNLVDAPMLLIDDEADNASIDISKDPEKASTINRRIRKLLALFNRSCYVGYTATPFANIFIDPQTSDEMLKEDLFPRDFIISLEAPSNYFGGEKIFAENGEADVVRPIMDNEDLLPIKHKNFHEVADLPPSLKGAVRTFLLARAIRILRGQDTAHNSMLVNASRFVSVQSVIRDLIHDYLSDLVRKIRFEKSGTADKALRDSDIRSIYDTWSEEYGDLEFEWSAIFGVLHKAASPIVVIEVNSKSATGLDYDAYEGTGRNVIAVGGFSLSRGLTLEGLTNSYFLRNSMMYDTLMQMGRWFGFRPGYEDVCRIWMTEEAEGWYQHITDSIEELRDELRRMEKARMTPKDFGLKVRSHPDTLIVTARNKMGTADSVAVRIGLANQFIETHAVPNGAERLGKNLNAARQLVAAICNDNAVNKAKVAGNIIWRDVPVSSVLNFLGEWTNQDASLQTAPEPVADYIRRRNPDELMVWDVVLIGVQKSDGEPKKDLGPEIFCQKRTVGRSTDDQCIYLSNKNRISSRGVERLGLSDLQIESAVKYWKEEARKKGKNPENVPDHVYRRERSKPLLILHLIELQQPNDERSRPKPIPGDPVVAWGISFPSSNADDPTVEYIVNTTWMQQELQFDRDEDQDAENDEE